MQGYRVKQGDISQHKGMSQEIETHKVIFDEDPLWQGKYVLLVCPVIRPQEWNMNGNIFSYIHDGINANYAYPISVTFLYMIGFYILLTCLGISPWISVFGANCLWFLILLLLIIEAGHNSKAFAIAYMAPVIGGLILAYRRKPFLGAFNCRLFYVHRDLC